MTDSVQGGEDDGVSGMTSSLHKRVHDGVAL